MNCYSIFKVALSSAQTQREMVVRKSHLTDGGLGLDNA